MSFLNFDPGRLPSPCYVIDRAQLEANLKVLRQVADQSGANIILALKAFSLPATSDLITQYLDGVCASGLFEARLGTEEFGNSVHTYGAAYPTAHLPELVQRSDHLVFNSLNQLTAATQALAAKPSLQVGLRLNPEAPVADHMLYDPSAPFSRLGLVRAAFSDDEIPDIVTGFHCHNLCGNGLAELVKTIEALETKFPALLARATWVNLGGGHAICQPDYDRAGLVALLKSFAEKHQVQVYLEPGETVCTDVGVLITEVLDLAWNGKNIAIVDSSSTAHIPDSIEAPYRVDLQGAGIAGHKQHDYRIGGLTCLSGDIMGDYSFDAPLKVGQRLLVEDTAYYTMVKTTTFNGVGLPSIAVWDSRTDALELVQEFDYSDFRRRLG